MVALARKVHMLSISNSILVLVTYILDIIYCYVTNTYRLTSREIAPHSAIRIQYEGVSEKIIQFI